MLQNKHAKWDFPECSPGVCKFYSEKVYSKKSFFSIFFLFCSISWTVPQLMVCVVYYRLLSANYENIHWQNIQVYKLELKYSKLKALLFYRTPRKLHISVKLINCRV